MKIEQFKVGDLVFFWDDVFPRVIEEINEKYVVTRRKAIGEKQFASHTIIRSVFDDAVSYGAIKMA